MAEKDFQNCARTSQTKLWHKTKKVGAAPDRHGTSTLCDVRIDVRYLDWSCGA